MAPTAVSSQPGKGAMANIKSMVTSSFSSSENRRVSRMTSVFRYFVRLSPLTSIPPANLSTLPEMLSWAAKTYGDRTLTFVTSPTATEVNNVAWLESSVKAMAYAFMTSFGSSTIGASSTGKKPIVIVYLSSHQDNMLAVWSALCAGFIPCLLPNLTAQLDHRKAHIEHINSLLTSDSVKPIWLTHQIGSGQLNEAGATCLNIKLFDDIKKAAASQECPKGFQFAPAEPDSEAILFLTSGSTGFSKAVVHTHRTILKACISKAEAYKLTPKSTIMNCKSLPHLERSIRPG
jgi:acyl-CoA synthetase (AMP-forming)/AMP-acid ligase II